ncbi:MAG: Arc family DNA-binding protein [Burkholderiaceae bacterium]|nr:Arc family DNA-binding protein [Burkholderiaceae bacterium]
MHRYIVNAQCINEGAEMIVGRDGEYTTVRVPKGMLAQLNEAARVNSRSRNTEIVVRLQESLKRDQKRIQRERGK